MNTVPETLIRANDLLSIAVVIVLSVLIIYYITLANLHKSLLNPLISLGIAIMCFKAYPQSLGLPVAIRVGYWMMVSIVIFYLRDFSEWCEEHDFPPLPRFLRSRVGGVEAGSAPDGDDEFDKLMRFFGENKTNRE